MRHVPNEAQALLEMEAVEQGYPPISLLLPLRGAWTVFSLLQLALRRPGIQAPLRATGEKFARALQNYCSATPALGIVAEAGWDPEFDEEPAMPAAAQPDPPEVATVSREIGEDLARAFAERIAARRVIESPMLAGSELHRVTLLFAPPSSAGLPVFMGSEKITTLVARDLRAVLTDMILEALRELKGKGSDGVTDEKAGEP